MVRRSMTSDFPLVSIVIPTFNNQRYLERCLDSVFQTDYGNFEVIVIDDHSTDDTPMYLEKLRAEKNNLRVIRNPKNLGHTSTVNTGFLVARGELIAKLDEDTITDRAWLSELVKVMLQEPRVAIAQSMSFRYHSEGLIPHLSGVCFDRLGRTRYKMISGVEKVFYPIAYAVLIRTELVRKIGGFYSDYFIYYEEVDFGWKAKLMGYDIVVVSSSKVRHMGAFKEHAPSLMKTSRPSFQFHEFKNHMSSLIINYETRNVVRYLFPYMAVIALQALIGLTRGKVDTCRDFYSAVVWNIRSFPRTYNRHRFTNRYLRKVPDTQILRKMSPLFLR